MTITVLHVQPAPVIENDLATDPTATHIHLKAVVPNDPGSDEAFVYSWTITDTATNTTLGGSGSAISFTRIANDSYTASVTVTDDDGGSATTTASITVAATGTTLPIPQQSSQVIAFALGGNTIDASSTTTPVDLVALGGHNTLKGR